MERTLLFNFPASLRDVRNWQHLGDVAILANDRFARQKQSSRKSIFDPGQNSPPDNASVAERIQCRRRHRVEVCRHEVRRRRADSGRTG
jgi:hypothetical protein